VCERCATTQKVADAAWLGEIAEIYRDYEMYHQSSAVDQPVFDPATGRPRGRCEVLAQRLHDSGALSESGSLLDVGAGSGAILAAFSAARAGWRLFRLDLDERKAPALNAIPRFEKLFTVAPERIPLQFELISLVHSLEHFADPLPMLESLRERLAPGGRIFIEVNDAGQMPFDLVVADHMSHFTPATLPRLLARAGLEVDALHLDWVNKEISLLAAPHSNPSLPLPADPSSGVEHVASDVAWLNALIEHARRSASGERFGIFGTSVAATWLAAGLGETVQFFVDEDPARRGRTHLGRRIFAPDEVAADAVVYLAFPPAVSRAIGERLRHLPVRFIAPPMPDR
jgi:SAM-dependent methyltransferase